jgi:hypothetical protein
VQVQIVAKAIFEQWFCKFGIPAQIHKNLLKEFLTKRMFGKEFVNKLLAELCAMHKLSFLTKR